MRRCTGIVDTYIHTYIHSTTDSHGEIKVCDSSHEAISYPASSIGARALSILESR